MKIALIQMPVCADKQHNVRTALQLTEQAAGQGARMAVLPEMFLCPYDNACFPQYAEPRGGQSWQAMSRAAAELGLTLVAGSIPERDGEKLYNTSFVFGPDGREIARHRKVHLFDIDVQGGQHFCESEVLTAGSEVTLFEAEGHRFGLCICFDVRFPELFRAMALKGAEAVLVPAAFNMTTGPMHWELTFRMRAVDNQLFTAGIAPARDEAGVYVSYANTIACSPWGKVLARAGTGPEVLMVDLDLEEVAGVRRQLPLLSARRPQVYGL